jgi:subtilisin family serine protease
MKKLFTLFALLVALSATNYSQIKKSNAPIKDSYIVVLKDGVDAKSVANGRAKHTFKHALNGFSAKLSKTEAEKLSKDPRVKYVEEDGVIKAADSEANPPIGIDRIDQRNTPLDSIYNYTYTGQGVKIYIIDTGINLTHTDFGGRAIVGLDVVGDGQNGNDCHGHGTHVAGIAGGTQYGVAKGATLVSMRILDCQAQGAISSLITALDWITANKNTPSVANISLEFGGISPSVDTSLANAKAQGVFIAAASGNSSVDACNVSPGQSPSVMDTAATSAQDDLIWLGSNYGSCVDILAPGLFIVSDYIGSTTATASLSGTSMAAPHVAGVAALYLQNAPLDGADTTKNFIASNATPNVIQGNLRGSPNLLLYSAFSVTPYTVPACSGQAYSGYISTGQTIRYPSDAGYAANAGTFTGSIVFGNNMNATFTLEYKRGTKWSAVTTPSSTTVSTTERSGTYRWAVLGGSGSGGLALCTTHP